MFDQIASKWLELLVEAVPHAQHIGVLFDPSLANKQQFNSVEATAAKLGKTLLPLRIDNADVMPNT